MKQDNYMQLIQIHVAFLFPFNSYLHYIQHGLYIHQYYLVSPTYRHTEDEEHSAIPPQYTLSPSETVFSIHQQSNMKSSMESSIEPLSIEECESDTQDIKENIVGFLFSMFNWMKFIYLQNFTSIFIQISILLLNHFLFLFQENMQGYDRDIEENIVSFSYFEIQQDKLQIFAKFYLFFTHISIFYLNHSSHFSIIYNMLP